MKRKVVLSLLPRRDASPTEGYPPYILLKSLTHLYSWMWRGTVWVQCFAQEHNTDTAWSRIRTHDPESSVRTRTSRPGVQCSNQDLSTQSPAHWPLGSSASPTKWQGVCPLILDGMLMSSPIPQHNDPPKAQNGGFGDCHHVAAPPHEKGDSIHTSKKNPVLGDYWGE